MFAYISMRPLIRKGIGSASRYCEAEVYSKIKSFFPGSSGGGSQDTQICTWFLYSLFLGGCILLNYIYQ